MFNKENFNKILTSAEANIKFIGMLGFFGFPAYYFIWHDIFPQEYENLTLRLINAAMFMPYIFYDKLPNKLRQIFPLYFSITLTICLPYSFSFMLLKNHCSTIWVMSIIAQTYLLIILVSDWKVFVVMTFSGIIAACATILFLDGAIVTNQFKIEYLPVLGFVLSSGIICIYKKDENGRQKIKMLKSIAGSIAHEVRNPLNSINLIRSQIEFLISKFQFSERGDHLNETEKELIDLTSKISKSIKRADEIINIALNDLRGEKVNPKHFSYLNAYDVISLAISEYSYNADLERRKVINKITKENSFIFKGDENLMIYIFFNLLKNALYYLKEYPNSTITISSKIGEFENFIYFEDAGPGIAKSVMKKLFGDFVTSGKEGGTGLGLSFCKRTMLSFGGNIICESEVKKYTRFILSFPKISHQEHKKLNAEKPSANPFLNRRKILVVDDNKTNLLIEKNVLEKNFGASCDTAENGHEALELFKKNKSEKYELILMDLEMPVMNGYQAISEIRKLDSTIPIIAYSSSFQTNQRIDAGKIGASECLAKPQKKEALSKVVSKWINAKYDPFPLKTRIELMALLQGKRIIIADDEETNLLMLGKYLENCKATVEKARNGKELIGLATKNKDYHLILTDINMPILDGQKAVLEIRKYEKEQQLKPIPIIAFTGNNEKETLHHLFKCGFDDYFTKGDYNEHLLKILGFWMSREENK